MKKILLILLLAISTFGFSQIYEMRYVAVGSTIHDTLYLKLNQGATSDSLFRLINSEYVFAALQRVRDYVPFFRLVGLPTTLSGYGITNGQTTLISATNIKTVNGSTLLGSGDLVVSGSDATKLAILNNLSDLNNAVTSRTNLGLGTLATQNGTISDYLTSSLAASTYGTIANLALKANLISPVLVTPLLGTPTSGNFSTGSFTWPTFNQNTSGTAAGLSANITQSQVANLTTDLAAKQATLESATNIKTINGASVLGSGDLVVSSAPTFINLISNFSNSTVTQTAVTGWTIPVVTGKTYRIEIIAAIQTAATGTGGTLGYYMLTGSGTIRGFTRGGISQIAAATVLELPVRICTTIGAVGSTLTTTGVTVINSPHSFYSIVTFTATASGNLQIGWASEVGASAAQINSGSSLIYQALN